jgi:hypothetical protein
MPLQRSFVKLLYLWPSNDVYNTVYERRDEKAKSKRIDETEAMDFGGGIDEDEPMASNPWGPTCDPADEPHYHARCRPRCDGGF